MTDRFQASDFGGSDLNQPYDIDALVRAHVAKLSAHLEEACERMLTSPSPVGVLYETWPDGSYSISLSTTEEPFIITERIHA